MLRLIGIGVLGNMLSPAAKHLTKQQSPAQFTRIFDRNPSNVNRQQSRQAWSQHGAKIVSSYDELIQGDFDGVVICAGKNGDDANILAELLPRIAKHFPEGQRPFIVHCSTVSVEFVEAAYDACRHLAIAYVNYPLTGGIKGAESASMLILASGAEDLYHKLQPFLSCLGKPRFFSSEVAAAAKIKLIGHVMVFNGLLGISSAVALQDRSVHFENLSQTEFFDFLNQGAGGTRQWDIAIKLALDQGDWQSGFLLSYATIDAIYTAELLLKYKLPAFTVYPILHLAASFSFLLQKFGGHMATQTFLKLLMTNSSELENFIFSLQDPNPKKFLENIVRSWPEDVRQKAKIDINSNDFNK